MEQMQREMELGDGMDPDEFSIGNSVEDPEPAPGEEVGVRGGWRAGDTPGSRAWAAVRGGVCAAYWTLKRCSGQLPALGLG